MLSRILEDPHCPCTILVKKMKICFWLTFKKKAKKEQASGLTQPHLVAPFIYLSTRAKYWVEGGGDTGKVSRFIWVVKAQHPQVSRYWWLFWVVLGHLAQNYHLAWKERGLEYFLFDNIQTYGVNRNRVRKSEGKGGLTNFLQNKPCG